MMKAFFTLATICCSLLLQAQVKHSGAMRNVMWKGQLQATVQLDTLLETPHLYGIGPLDSLQGELTIWDGVPFAAEVGEKDGMLLRTDSAARAPFLVYAHVQEWSPVPVPDSVKILAQLEQLLHSHFRGEPFVFRLEGKADGGSIHVVNLAPGTIVKNPEDVHRNNRNYAVSGPFKAIGFYSDRHQGIYTHHDSRIHVHLLMEQQRMMGHLDSWSGSTVLWIGKW